MLSLKQTDMMESLDELTERFKRIIEWLESNNSKGYKQSVKNIENANEAVRLFTESVVKNRDQVMDKNGFRRLLRAYLNIMLYAKKKKKIEEALGDLDWITDDTKNRIIQLSKPGRYWSIARILPRMHKQMYPHRKEFLDLIEEFRETNEYAKLREGVRKFAALVPDKTPAFMTGLLAALRPTQFMVYNRRSVVPLWNTRHGCLAYLRMETYLDFNAAYKNLEERTELPLLILDVAANQMYCDTTE